MLSGPWASAALPAEAALSLISIVVTPWSLHSADPDGGQSSVMVSVWSWFDAPWLVLTWAAGGTSGGNPPVCAHVDIGDMQRTGRVRGQLSPFRQPLFAFDRGWARRRLASP